MKANRIISALAALLCVAVVALAFRVVQLRHQLTHAQAYVQSGLANWRFACTRVSAMLRAHQDDRETTRALKDVANACLSHSDYATIETTQALSDDLNSQDLHLLIQRVDRAVETGDYLIVKDKPNGDYPKGY